jgi:hypothetical protein
MMLRVNSFALALVGVVATGDAALAQVPYWHDGGQSVIAQPLRAPPVGSDASPRVFLLAARNALRQGRTGEAREALERAETRLLDRSVLSAGVRFPDRQPLVLDVGVARHALASGDRQSALRAIDDALVSLEQAPSPPALADSAIAAAPMPLGRVTSSTPVPAVSAAPAPPPPPPVTYALLPGHWQLQGANYVWIPPETTPRLVVSRPLVPNQYVWKGGTWVYIPQHYGDWNDGR